MNTETRMNTVQISYSSKVFKPEFIEIQKAIVIRSPIDLKLTPRSSAWVDTEIKIDFDTSKLCSWINPSSTFKTLGLSIADETNWYYNKTVEDTIMIHLQNISFYYNVEIRKGDILAFIFFNGCFFEIKYKLFK